jgi:hypothetical protein
MLVRRIDSRVWFLGCVGVVLVAILSIVRSQLFARNPTLLSAAASCDLLFTLPLLYYVFVIRTRIAKPITLVPAFLGCLTLARWILPTEGRLFLHPFVFVSPPLELVSIGLLLWRIRRYFEERKQTSGEDSGDWLERLQHGMKAILGDNRLNALLATEIAVFYFGVVGWFLKPQLIPGATTSTCYRKSGWGGLVGVLSFLVVVEGSVIHVLLSQHSVLAAWMWNAFDLYALLFLFADFQALRLRPLVLTAESLTIRLGLRWQGTVPLAKIATMEKFAGIKREWSRSNYVKIAVASEPEILLTLREPIEFTGILGMKRQVFYIGLSVDEPGLIKQLREGIENQ